MSPPSDALRNTLDSLQLDPSAKEDRHYLITVLRRLGYSEVEIREALGEPEALPEPAEPDDRAIEVEYLASSESKEFEPVVRMSRAAPAPQPVADEMDFVTVEPEMLRFEEAKRLRMRVVHADSPEQAEDQLRSQGHVARAFPVSVASHDHSAAPAGAPAWDAPAEEWPQEESSWEQAPAAPAEAWEPAESWEEGSWQEAPAAPAPWPEEAPAAPAAEPEPAAEPAPAAWPSADGAYQHNGYTLHARDVELSTGKSQRIYFFAKGTPSNGTPSPMPAGYEVRENDKTGLPYLAREGS